MIGSLLSSVIPSSSFGVQDSDGNDAPAVRAVISTSLTRGDATGSDVTGSEDGGRRLRLGGHDFTRAAKHMIRDALKTFSHDLRDSFKDLGFKTDMVMRLAHEVMQAAKQALKSGADFTANLMMAAITQTTTTSAAGSTSSFAMVASEIEITINQSTGSIEVSVTQVEIQSQMSIGAGAATPLLVDFSDTDGETVAPMLAMNDLESFLLNDDGDAEPEAMGPVLASLPDAAPVEAEDADPIADPDAVATEESDGAVGATEDAGDIVPVPEVIGVARIIITAFERYLNSEGEQITYFKLDAVIPLTIAPDSVAEEMAEEMIEDIVEPTEVPLAEQVIEEPVGQPATTDLLV